jgi:hypothetical protein
MSDQHHHQHEHGHSHASVRKPLHRDWRAWTVVVIMLAAIAMYLFSGDEMFGLRPKAQPAPPAAGGK